MSERILMLYDERMLDHVNGPGHPERPDRLRAILRELARSPVEGLEWFKPNAASLEQVRRVHSVAHVDRIDLMRGRTARLDPDTGVSPGSTEAAYCAAGAAVIEIGLGDDLALCADVDRHDIVVVMEDQAITRAEA